MLLVFVGEHGGEYRTEGECTLIKYPRIPVILYLAAKEMQKATVPYAQTENVKAAFERQKGHQTRCRVPRVQVR